MQAHNIYLQTLQLQSDKYGGLAVGLWLDNLYILSSLLSREETSPKWAEGTIHQDGGTSWLVTLV